MPNACGSIYKLNCAYGFDVRSPKQMKMLDFEGKKLHILQKKFNLRFLGTPEHFYPLHQIFWPF